jgi:catechol 2,3-dioxygenase-like lactoylglutathione lyase family enzyme
LDADKEALLDMELDAKGRDRLPVRQSVRQIMAHQRVGGIKLWQCIAMRHDGTFKGFYTNGTGCTQHEEKANEFGGSLGAHLRYLCLGKGVAPESVNQLLAKCFSGQARREADEAKFIKGKVYTARQANFQADLDAMEHGWLDVARGMPRLKRVEYERNKDGAAIAKADGTNIKSALTPGDPKGLQLCRGELGHFGHSQ